MNTGGFLAFASLMMLLYLACWVFFLIFVIGLARNKNIFNGKPLSEKDKNGYISGAVLLGFILAVDYYVRTKKNKYV